MDKDEFRIKLEQINHLVEKSDYKGAMEIVDTIDWRRVKNVRTLCIVGEIYAANKRYEDSKNTFLLAYHRAPIGKSILSKLIEVSIKAGDVDEAMEFYEEYIKVAPKDTNKYVLKYQIYKANNASNEELIKILEEYKDKEFTEKWSYELAKLYFQNGDKEKCVSLCDEMELWFSDGKYVMKALDLKMKLGAMTSVEKERFEKKFASLLNEEEMSAVDGAEESAEEKDSEREGNSSEDDENSNEAIESISTKEEDVNYSESLQERITKGIRDIFNTRRHDEEVEEDEEEDEDAEEMMQESSVAQIFGEDVPDLEEEDDLKEEKSEKEEDAFEDLLKEMTAEDEEETEEAEAAEVDEDTEDIEEETEDAEVVEEEEDTLSDMIPEDIFEEVKEELNDSEENIKDLEDELLESFDDELDEELIEEPVKPAKRKSLFSLKMPEFKIPKGMKKFNKEESLKVPEIPKVANIGLVEPVAEEDPEEEKDEFNLEDSILAAAFAQGIDADEDDEEIVDEDDEEIVDEDDEEIVDEDDEEIVDEDDEEIEDEDDEEIEDEDDEEIVDEDDEEIVDEDDEEIVDEDDEEIEDEIDEDFDYDFGEEAEEEEDSDEDFDISFEDELKLEMEKSFEESFAAEFDEMEEEEDVFEDEFILDKKPEKKTADEDFFLGDIDLENQMVARSDKLDEEERKLFSYLATVPGMEKQLVDVLKDAQDAAADKTSRTGNIVVMGGRECGKTRLISGLIPAICRELHLEASKVAYVFAEQINGKNIPEIVNKLSSGFLVIEDANRLTRETVNQLDKAMEFRTDGLTIILEDEKMSMRKLLARYPKFAKKFTSEINIPVFTNDELVSFAGIYVAERGYSIEQNGLDAIYEKIGILQKQDEPVNIGVVKEMLDDAIEKYEAGSRKFRLGFSKKRTDKVLNEQDFK